MHQHKLTLLLQQFDRKAMTRFEEMARSPYFNKHEDVQGLVAYLSRVFPHLDERRCQREVVSQALWPGQVHDQGKLAVVFTYTWRLAEQFLVQEQFKGQAAQRDLLLLRGLRHWKQYARYEKQLQRAAQQAQEQPMSDSSHYHAQYRLAEEADDYWVQVPGHQDDSLQRKQHYLDHFYLVQKLRDAVEMHIRRNILNVDYSARLLEAAWREVNDNRAAYAQEPAILMYHSLYRMVTDADTQGYFDALQVLKTHEGSFGVAERTSIYNYFQNYCIERINRNDTVFLTELFHLYQSQLAQSLLMEDGYLLEWHYKNIVTTAIRLGELQWAEEFIEAYRHQLPPDSADNAWRFNYAALCHACGRYDEVLQLLTQVAYSDLRYSLGARALLLRTYYELGEDEALMALAESFRQYLLRNQLMADMKRNGYYNLFKFTRRAAQLRADIGFEEPEKLRKALQKLRSDIAEAEAIFNKGWLEEKVRELVV